MIDRSIIAGTGNFVQKTGDTMTGALNMAANGIVYSGVAGANAIAYAWGGGRIDAYVDAFLVGTLAYLGDFANYVAKTGDTMSGTLDVQNGRIISTVASTNPSITLHDPAAAVAAGMWLDGNTAALLFGAMDGIGNGGVGWATMQAGMFWHSAEIRAATAITAGTTIAAGSDISTPTSLSCATLNASSAVLCGGGLFQIAPNYYMARGGDGAWSWVEGGIANLNVDAAGNLTANASIRADARFGGGVFSMAMNPGDANQRGLNFSNQDNAWIYNAGNGSLSWLHSGIVRMQIDAIGNCANGTGSWGMLSDARYKNITEEFTRGLEELVQLQPVTYTLTDERLADNPPLHGLIAQDVLPIIPEAVITFEENRVLDEIIPERYGVTMMPLILTCINALKEIDARLNALEGGALLPA